MRKQRIAVVDLFLLAVLASVSGRAAGPLSFAQGRTIPPSSGAENDKANRQFPPAKPLVTIREGTQTVVSLAFSPDSKVLAGGDGEGKIRFWDPATGRRLKQFLVHDDRAATWSKVAFSPDGSLVATIRDSTEGDMRLWDWKAERELARLTGMGLASGLAFDPKGKTIAVMDNHHIFLFDIEKKKVMNKLAHKEGGFTSCLSFSPDGKKLASSGAALPRIRIWDCRKGKEERVISPKEDDAGFTGVYWAKDGGNLLAVGPGRSVSRWDVATGKELKRYPLRRGIGASSTATFALSPDESIIAVGMQDESEFLRGPEFQSSEVSSTYGLPAFSPDGKRLATTYSIVLADRAIGAIAIWDTAVIGNKSK